MMALMQLTKFTDLGLRVLMYVSQSTHTRMVSISELAQQLNVPRNHLIKVVTVLNKTGWIQATRGPGGGLRLGMDPASLALGLVVRTLEGKQSLVDCAQPPCPLAGSCGLKGALDESLSVFYRHLDTYSLADVTPKHTSEIIVHLQQKHLQTMTA
jgi:Rrf2 family transcriptional regulator, nitric oxide-sensitive transcriptional repressor